MIIVQISDLHCADAEQFLQDKLTMAIYEINILFSGAVSTIRLRGFFENSYNVIRIENEKIRPQLKIVGDAFIDFNKLIRKQQ